MGEVRRRERGRSGGQDRVDPAFHRAILKIAIELRKPRTTGYESVVADTIRSMKLDGPAFRRYLGQNGARDVGLLPATARAFAR